jgi:disulfide oxidoreductase YuzD
MTIIIPEWGGTGRQYSRLGDQCWSIARLIALSKDFPIIEIPLCHLDISHSYKEVRLRDMVMHMQAVNNADLAFPIILDEDGEIMDGRHRIMKAILQGKKNIKAVRFETNPCPCKIEG